MGPGLAVYDVIYLTVASILYGVALLVGAEVFALLGRFIPWAFAVVPSAVCGLLALIAQVWVLSALLPRLRSGRYPLMGGAVFYGWLFRSLLRRVLHLPGLKWVLMSSNILRFLSLRAMGAKVAFTANMSADVDVLDPSLLTVAAGATIGARSFISGHWVEGGKLVLGEVRVGPGALLAAEVMVGPGAVIGAKAVVKARTSVAPEVTIGDGADVGAHCVLEPGATVEAGARIALGERVRR